MFGGKTAKLYIRGGFRNNRGRFDKVQQNDKKVLTFLSICAIIELSSEMMKMILAEVEVS